MGDVKILPVFPTAEIAVGVSAGMVKIILIKQAKPDGMIPLVLTKGKGRGSAR